MKRNNRIQNRRLLDDDDIYEDEEQLARSRAMIADSDRKHLQQRRNRFPIKAVGLALFLFSVGSIALGLSIMLLRRDPIPDNAYPLLIIGTLTFLPGFYYVRIAVWSFFKYPGWKFEDIPDYE
jgi:hypothetical protein